MVDRHRRARFVEEPLDPIGALVRIGEQQLDRGGPAEHAMRRREHHTHPAATELAIDEVVADDAAPIHRCERSLR